MTICLGETQITYQGLSIDLDLCGIDQPSKILLTAPVLLIMLNVSSLYGFLNHKERYPQTYQGLCGKLLLYHQPKLQGLFLSHVCNKK